MTRDGTCVWPAPEGIAECKFFKIREVSGKEITLSEGTAVKQSLSMTNAWSA